MARNKNEDAERQEVVIFRLGQQRYGLEVLQVIEVLHMVAITEVPNPPPGLLGMINYRGSVIPLIELRRAFGMQSHKLQINTFIVVAEHQGSKLAMIVDSVDGVENLVIDREGSGEYIVDDTQYLRGIAEFDESLVLMLDLTELMGRYRRKNEYVATP